MSESSSHGHLPRLTPGHYRGFAFVHWVMTVEERATGWLNDLFHSQFREAMMHVLVRHDLFYPAYCLMPDHVHIVWLGSAAGSEQRQGLTSFRRATNRLLAPQAWQREPCDHVLREEERKRDAFPTVCRYVFDNPVRKNLVREWRNYPYSDALVPGYVDLNPKRDDFWPVFWMIYNRRVSESRSAP